MIVGLRIGLGALAGAAVALAGLRARALSRTGATAAAIVGTVAVAAGWDWAIVLITYFGVSSMLSRVGARRRSARLAGVVDKTGSRDATQVFANGFPFVFCALMSLITPDSHLVVWKICGAASLAASAADTWSTEIGTLVGQTPRSILTMRQMAVGESGGVTLAGWIAALAGAAFVAGVAAWSMRLDLPGFGLIVVGGLAGAIADSIAGASVQRRSWCDTCGRSTEMHIHSCGTPTRHVGGLAWLENDGVNLLSTVTGAAVAGLLLLALIRSVGNFL